MQISVIGLNHNSAPIEVRESAHVSEGRLLDTYSRLLSDPRVHEAVILSTCNRVEYYIVTEKNLNDQDILYITAQAGTAPVRPLRDHTYFFSGREAVEHLVTVASGIDSLVMGEPQIFGQVKTAFKRAREISALGSYLNRLEQFVLSTTKKVRTDTALAQNAVSVSYAAVQLAGKIFGDLSHRRALIVGAGEMCELAAQHLAGAGIASIVVTNRTFERGEELAKRFGGSAFPFDELSLALEGADIVIASTGAPNAVISKEMVAAAMKKRRNAPMFFIDIAIPRDVEAAVSDVENVYVYDIDDLKGVVEANRKAREEEAVKAFDIIRSAVKIFERNTTSLTADPAIKALRSYMTEIRQLEFEKYVKKNGLTEEEREKLSAFLQTLENKILHNPTVNLKSAAAGKKYTLDEAVNMLFKIEVGE